MEKLQLWTDYPIVELGDEPGKEAPVRRAKLLEYDGDKYVTCEIDGIITSFKSGYLYMREGRCGKVPPATRRTCEGIAEGIFREMLEKCSK